MVWDRVKIINGATKGPSWVEKHEWIVTKLCADGVVEIQGSGDRNGLFMQIAESKTILLEFHVDDIVELMDVDGDYSRRGHHRVRRGADASGYLEIEKVGGSSPSICQVVAWCAKLVKRTDPGGVYDANDKGLLELAEAVKKPWKVATVSERIKPGDFVTVMGHGDKRWEVRKVTPAPDPAMDTLRVVRYGGVGTDKHSLIICARDAWVLPR